MRFEIIEKDDTPNISEGAYNFYNTNPEEHDKLSNNIKSFSMNNTSLDLSYIDFYRNYFIERNITFDWLEYKIIFHNSRFTNDDDDILECKIYIIEGVPKFLYPPSTINIITEVEEDIEILADGEKILLRPGTILFRESIGLIIFMEGNENSFRKYKTSNFDNNRCIHLFIYKSRFTNIKSARKI